MDVGLDAPVEVHVGKRGVVWEEAGVPAAHLVVGDFVGVLDAVFGEEGGGFGEEGGVDPGWGGPVGGGNCGEGYRGGGGGADAAFEGFGEGLVVEEGPGIVEFVVEGCFEIADGLDELFELGVADEGEEGGFYAVGVGIIGRIVVAIDAVERTGRFVDNCMGEILAYAIGMFCSHRAYVLDWDRVSSGPIALAHTHWHLTETVR